jgi:hypothetical protein
MDVKLIYMDMPRRVKAFSMQNDDLSYTVVINKSSDLVGSESEAICKLLTENSTDFKTQAFT